MIGVVTGPGGQPLCLAVSADEALELLGDFARRGKLSNRDVLTFWKPAGDHDGFVRAAHFTTDGKRVWRAELAA